MGPDAEPKVQKASKERLATEIEWALKCVAIMLRNWTMNSMPNAIKSNATEGASARSFALILIVGLAFAVRADIDPSSQLHAYSGAAIAAAIGGILTVILNLASNYFAQLHDLDVRERWLISAYTSTILVMLLFVFFDTVLTGYVWYDLYSRLFGVSVIPTLLAIIVTFLSLYIKAKFFNRNIFGLNVVLHNFLVVLGCGAIVYIVSIMSSEMFQNIFKTLSGKA